MADAQYVIDIAANMSGGEKTSAELDALVADLTAGGKGADFFSEAIARTSNELTAAQSASKLAAASLAETSSEFVRLERAALQLGKAADKTAQKFGASSQEYLDAALASEKANADLNAYTATLRKAEAQAEAAAKAESKLATQLKNVRQLSAHADKSFNEQAEGLGKIQGALGAVGGPLGSLGNIIVGPQKAFAELSGVMGGAHAQMLLLAAGAAILIAALAVLATALVVGTVKVAAWAVGLADAAQQANLTEQAVLAMNPAFKELDSTVKAISRSTNMATEEIQGIAVALKKAKVSAADMPAALKAAALAEVALGKGGSAQFTDRLAEGKQTAQELAAEFETKLGPIVAKQMKGLGAQSERLNQRIGRIFGGLDIAPVQEAFAKLVSNFDETSAVGGTIKFLFETMFQPLINAVTVAYPLVERLVIGIASGFLKAYIAIKPTIQSIKNIIALIPSFGGMGTALSSIGTIAELLGRAFFGLAVAAGIIVAGFAAIGAAVAIAFAAVGSFFGLAVQIGAKLLEWQARLWEFKATILRIGYDLMLGLAQGIMNGGAGVVDAIVGAVTKAITAAKKLLGIASPSKLFKSFGVDTTDGFALGVEAGNDNAVAAVSTMATDVADAGMPSETAMVRAGAQAAQAQASGAVATATEGAPASAGSGASVVVQGNTFVFHGIADGKQAVESLSEVLTRMIEGDAQKLGAA